MSRRPSAKPSKIDRLSVPCTRVFVNPARAERTAGEIGSLKENERGCSAPAADVCRLVRERKA